LVRTKWDCLIMHRNFKILGMGSIVCPLVLGGYLLAIQLTGNFYEVVPGELYRSNQPTAAQIADYRRRYGIKTIINLRGRSEDAAWYRDEIATAASLGVKHIDFRMSARKQLTLAETGELLAILREVPKPLLIHCKSGSDRTGLASVIYLQQIANVNEETAERQLSLRFGHVGIPFLSPAYAMDENWENLEKAFGLPG
jgi:protein tyrosine/serine phosphatase